MLCSVVNAKHCQVQRVMGKRQMSSESWSVMGENIQIG